MCLLLVVSFEIFSQLLKCLVNPTFSKPVNPAFFCTDLMLVMHVNSFQEHDVACCLLHCFRHKHHNQVANTYLVFLDCSWDIIHMYYIIRSYV